MRDLVSRNTFSSGRSVAITVLLIFVSVWGLALARTSGMLQVTSTTSPTATYSGFIAMSFYGTYHYVLAVPVCRHNFIPCLSDDQTVFYLDTSEGRVQLIFYCGAGYCENPSQISLVNGTLVHAKGTLIVPSIWPGKEFEPILSFTGDFYVFSYEIT